MMENVLFVVAVIFFVAAAFLIIAAIVLFVRNDVRSAIRFLQGRRIPAGSAKSASLHPARRGERAPAAPRGKVRAASAGDDRPTEVAPTAASDDSSTRVVEPLRAMAHGGGAGALAGADAEDAEGIAVASEELVAEQPTEVLSADDGERTERGTGMLSEGEPDAEDGAEERLTELLEDDAAESAERPTGVLVDAPDAGDSERPTGILVDDDASERLTGVLVEDDEAEGSERPTGILTEGDASEAGECPTTALDADGADAGGDAEASEAPTGCLDDGGNTAERPTDILDADAAPEESERPTGVLDAPDAPGAPLDGAEGVAQHQVSDFAFIVKQNVIVVHAEDEL